MDQMVAGYHVSPAAHCYRWSLSAGVCMTHMNQELALLKLFNIYVHVCVSLWLQTINIHDTTQSVKLPTFHCAREEAAFIAWESSPFIRCKCPSFLAWCSKPYPSHTTQTLITYIPGAPSFRACLDQKPGEDNPGASKLSQMVFIWQCNKSALEGSHSRQVCPMKGRRQTAASRASFIETGSRSRWAFLLALKEADSEAFTSEEVGSKVTVIWACKHSALLLRCLSVQGVER